jgi:carbon monoxide dehydrogenase subunit G
MTSVSRMVLIPRPRDAVFDYLADFSNTAEWDPGVARSVKAGPGPVGLGSTFDLVARFRGREVPVTYRVTVYERPSRVVLVGENKRFTGTDDIRLTEEANGTSVSWNARFRMKGLARLLSPFLKGVFEELSDDAMDGLVATLAPF